MAASKLVYCCSSYKNGGEAACDAKMYVKRDKAERAIIDHLRKYLGTPAAIRTAQAAYASEMAANTRKVAPDTSALDREETNLLAFGKSGALSQETVGVALADIDRKRKRSK